MVCRRRAREDFHARHQECRHELGLPHKASHGGEWRSPGSFTAEFAITAFANIIAKSPVLEDQEQMISDAFDASLAGYAWVFGRALEVSIIPAVKADRITLRPL